MPNRVQGKSEFLLFEHTRVIGARKSTKLCQKNRLLPHSGFHFVHLEISERKKPDRGFAMASNSFEK